MAQDYGYASRAPLTGDPRGDITKALMHVAQPPPVPPYAMGGAQQAGLAPGAIPPPPRPGAMPPPPMGSAGLVPAGLGMPSISPMTMAGAPPLAQPPIGQPPLTGMPPQYG